MPKKQKSAPIIFTQVCGSQNTAMSAMNSCRMAATSKHAAGRRTGQRARSFRPHCRGSAAKAGRSQRGCDGHQNQAAGRCRGALRMAAVRPTGDLRNNERTGDCFRCAIPGNVLVRLGAAPREKAKGWDDVLLVQYPTRTAFTEMVEDSEYQVAFQAGKSALADIVLQPLKISKDC
jgi:hypothetical protein